MHLLFVDHLLQEMDTRLLVVQNHYVVQYLSPRQRMNVTLDCPGVRGVPRRHASRSTAATTWKARYEMVNVAKRPNTLDDTIQEINPVRYPNMCTVVIQLMMSVSTAIAERSFSAMRRPSDN